MSAATLETSITTSLENSIDESTSAAMEASQMEQSIAEAKRPSSVVKTLPTNVWTNILEQFILEQFMLGEKTIPEILLLRGVSPWFNDEILGILFTRQLIDFTRMWRYTIPLDLTVCFIQGFFAQRKLPQRTHKQMRRAMLRAAGLDPRISDATEGTCLTLKPKQPCLRQVVGPSTGITCRMHDMMEAIALALASNVFFFGCSANTTLSGFPITDSRYWSLLTIVYQLSKAVNNEHIVSELRNMLSDLFADVTLSEDHRTAMICDCFVLAARSNKPDLIDILYILADEEKELASHLGRRVQAQNALWESISLGHVEVHHKFLSKKWEFDTEIMTYSSCISNIIYQKRQPASTRAKMLRSVFDWSSAWRNTNTMETLLICIGNSREAELMEAVVSALKAQHFFSHPTEEEDNPYHGPPQQPLWSLSHHDNPTEMIKSFLDNRSLILPRMKPEKWKEMRTQTLQLLFRDRSGTAQRGQAKVEVLKLIMEHSDDLIEAKHTLQQTLIMNCDEVPLEKWDWLAEKLGLDAKCDQAVYEGHTLGSALMEEAVEKLNVEVVRFLVKNGAGLVKEATTVRVKEEDEVAMKKLKTITELLAEGGQGEYTQKRTVSTTFSASKVVPPKPKRKSVVEPNSIVRVSNTVVRMAHSSRTRFSKKMSISKRHGTKSGTKSASIVTTQSVSSGSSVTG